MFDISAHSKAMTGETGQNRKDAGKTAESFDQNIVSCHQILAGMSREMRTEMNAIVAFSFLLNKKEYSDVDREEFSKQIYSSCEKIISLFDNFLDFAIIDTGNSISESGTCNPNEVINDLFADLRDILKQEKYNDLIFVTDNQTFNNTEYLIDTNRVTRVIRNLFQNALNNTKSGYIKAGYDLANDKFTFYILDSGQGYSKCKEFLQSSNIAQSLARFSDISTAVNLALTRKLIKMMGGSIRIESNGLSGSAIYFSVPVSKDVNAEDTINKFSNTMSTI